MQKNRNSYKIFWRYSKGIAFLLIIVLFNSACMSYYQKMSKFQTAAESGHIEQAAKLMHSNKKVQKPRNRLLYLMNAGWAEHMLSNSKKSNKLLNEADLMIEDYQKQMGLEALTLLSNPTIKPYRAESVESVMLNYYKAMNYLTLNDRKGALVEARKMTNKLYALNDKYKGKQNRYSDDAFAHILIGMIYEADGDYHNAMIAYRNAIEVYEKVYLPNFAIPVPDQLKNDVLRVAYLSSNTNELKRFERKFSTIYKHQKAEAQLVLFWESGFGPVKKENRIEFVKVGNSGAGIATFVNKDMDLSFPVVVSDMKAEEKSALASFEIFQLAFPQYLHRKPLYHKASVQVDGKKFPLSLAQDIEAISFKVLKDRMLREIGGGIARLVAKKAVEAAVRAQNQDVGAIIGILNAVTEVADTRNWQTLPHSISYIRVPVKPGKKQIELSLQGSNMQVRKIKLEVELSKGQTRFVNYRSLASKPPR